MHKAEDFLSQMQSTYKYIKKLLIQEGTWSNLNTVTSTIMMLKLIETKQQQQQQQQNKTENNQKKMKEMGQDLSLVVALTTGHFISPSQFPLFKNHSLSMSWAKWAKTHFW